MYSDPIWIWLRYCVKVLEKKTCTALIKVLGEGRRYLYYFATISADTRTVLSLSV